MADKPQLDMTLQMKTEVTMYSVVVGLLILLLCVAPCVLFALLAKCFQSQSPRRRSSTLRSVLSAGIKLLDSKESSNQLDSIGFGAFGPMQLSPSQLDVIEKIASIKPKLPCVSVWKAYAPAIMMSGDKLTDKRLVCIKKLTEVSSSDVHNKDAVSHSQCLRSELQQISQIPAHYHIQNLLGVCLHNSNPVALIMEHCPFGCLHTYLHIKRRARLSNNSNTWAGLDFLSEDPQAIKALEEVDRDRLSSMLDDYQVRSQAFTIPLCQPFSELDILLFGLQLATVMDFLCDQGFLHKRISTENVLIGPGFYLKVTGVDFEAPMMHRSNSSSRVLRRTASGRNVAKWDAPEVMEREDYSEKSEVWRFGMTVWEMCSLGDSPFEDVPFRSLTDLLKKGNVPMKPEGTTDRLYSLMTQCWAMQREARPSFEAITEQIKASLRSIEFNKLHPLKLDALAAEPEYPLPRRRISAFSSPYELVTPDPELSRRRTSAYSSPMEAQDLPPLFSLPGLSGYSPETHSPPEQRGTELSQDSNLCRRPARRPVVLPISPQGVGNGGGFTPLLDDISPSPPVAGYLETDV